MIILCFVVESIYMLNCLSVMLSNGVQCDGWRYSVNFALLTKCHENYKKKIIKKKFLNIVWWIGTTPINTNARVYQ